MGATSERGWTGDFWGFYRAYARTGIHAASAVAVTVGFGAAQFAWWFPLLGLCCYVIPLVYLYATGYTPSSHDDTATSTPESDETDRSTPADRDTRPSTPENSPEPSNGMEAEPTTHQPSPGSENSATGAERAEDRPEPSGAGASDGSDEPAGWSEADSPVEIALFDVTLARTEPYAVGEGGVVLARRSDGWKAVLEHGPSADSNTLRGVDATVEGRHVWFVGDSGVLGQYDTEKERLTDHSAPEDRTSTWEDCAVVGPAGEERLFLVNGSGEVVRGKNDEGELTWGEGTKPGSGSSIAAIEFAGEYGVVCDTNGTVFETTDDGESYEKIGIEDANATFTDVAAVDSETVVVACDDGSVVRYDGTQWTERHVGDGALAAIDRTPEAGLAAGAGGSLYERTADGWKSVSTPTETDLSGVVIGSEGQSERAEHDWPAVAVGADGTIIER